MDLQDELWLRVIGDTGLDCRDLCMFSMACRRFRRLGIMDCNWQPLYEREFGKQSTDSDSYTPWKIRFKTRFEREKESKLIKHKRLLLRTESEVLVLKNECRDLTRRIQSEQKKLSTAISELSRIKHAREASVALQMWQPRVVRTRHEQVIQQQEYNLGAHTHSVEMEVKVCQEQVQRFKRNWNNKKAKLAQAEAELCRLNYRPLP